MEVTLTKEEAGALAAMVKLHRVCTGDQDNVDAGDNLIAAVEDGHEQVLSIEGGGGGLWNVLIEINQAAADEPEFLDPHRAEFGVVYRLVKRMDELAGIPAYHDEGEDE